MSHKRVSLGKTGEKHARRFLEKKGYRILQSNYRTRFGEIDLVAQDRDTLVFIEVKTRNDQTYGSAFAAITLQKQRHLGMAALDYLQRHDMFGHNARFDAVAVTMEGSKVSTIEHIENAFELCCGS